MTGGLVVVVVTGAGGAEGAQRGPPQASLVDEEGEHAGEDAVQDEQRPAALSTSWAKP